MSIDTPHLSFPFSVTDGTFDIVEQDSPEHLAQRVLLTVNTFIGDRLEDPDFGIPDSLLQAGGTDLEELRAAIAASEPDAAPLVDRMTDLTDLDRVDRLRILIDEDTNG